MSHIIIPQFFHFSLFDLPNPYEKLYADEPIDFDKAIVDVSLILNEYWTKQECTIEKYAWQCFSEDMNPQKKPTTLFQLHNFVTYCMQKIKERGGSSNSINQGKAALGGLESIHTLTGRDEISKERSCEYKTFYRNLSIENARSFIVYWGDRVPHSSLAEIDEFEAIEKIRCFDSSGSICSVRVDKFRDKFSTQTKYEIIKVSKCAKKVYTGVYEDVNSKKTQVIALTNFRSHLDPVNNLFSFRLFNREATLLNSYPDFCVRLYKFCHFENSNYFPQTKHVPLLQRKRVALLFEEYCKYGALFSLIHTKEKYNELTMQQKKNIINRLIEFVDFLHSNKLLHMDFKLQNVGVIIDEHGNIFLKLFDLESVIPIELTPDLISCKEGLITTPSDRPPEFVLQYHWIQQVEGVERYKYDIWCLGLSLYQIYFGENLIDPKVIDENERKKHIEEDVRKNKCSIDDAQRKIDQRKNLLESTNSFLKLVNSLLEMDYKKRPFIEEITNQWQSDAVQAVFNQQ